MTTPTNIERIAGELSEAQKRALTRGDARTLSASDAGLMQQAELITMRFFGHSLGADLTDLGLAVRSHLLKDG